MPAPHGPQRERDAAKATKLWGGGQLRATFPRHLMSRVAPLIQPHPLAAPQGPPRLKPDPLVSKENPSLHFLHLCDVPIAPSVEARQQDGSFPGFSGMERSECS